ncbi:MAG: RDD family protein [Propionibacteriaceae bacterium]|nr:RDD family protein [Propionibacteriaceae bacterium]
MSDEIPVGSPPAPPGRHAAPGGWYADPVAEGRERYWDGWQWTRNVRPRPGGRARSGHPPQDQVQPGQPPGAYAPQSGPAAYRMVPATADGVPLAGWGWRALAFAVDYFLLNALTQFIAMVTPLGAGIRRSTNAYEAYLTEVLTTDTQVDFAHLTSLLMSTEMIISSVISTLLFIVYSGLMLRARGATLGKMLFRLRVVPVDQGQSPPGLPGRQAWLRPTVTQVFGLLWPVALIDYLFPLWDRRRQTLHDKVVTTQVIRVARGLPQR